MAFEIGDCSPEEYRDGIPNRVPEDELQADLYYTWILSLTTGPYKVPARIEEAPVLQDKTSGLFMVRNTLVDENGRPFGPTRNHIFHDGFYMREERHDLARLGEFAFHFSNGTERVYTGYFRDDYADGPPPPGEEVGVELEVPAEVLERSEELQPVAA